MEKLKAAAQTSEFWISIATLVGQAGVAASWWSQEDWNNLLYPALVYVVARVTSKAVKKGTPNA